MDVYMCVLEYVGVGVDVYVGVRCWCGCVYDMTG